jgi:hypothetical protein
MAAPEWTSPAFLPGNRGVVDPAQGGVGRLSWGVDVQVDLLQLASAQSLTEGLLDSLVWTLR